jgi:hypothetical protein
MAARWWLVGVAARDLLVGDDWSGWLLVGDGWSVVAARWWLLGDSWSVMAAR